MEPPTLLIFVTDSVTVQDKTTFSSYLYQDIHVTHWFENTDDTDKSVAGIYDILFKEVIRKRNLPLEKHE